MHHWTRWGAAGFVEFIGARGRSFWTDSVGVAGLRPWIDSAALVITAQSHGTVHARVQECTVLVAPQRGGSGKTDHTTSVGHGGLGQGGSDGVQGVQQDVGGGAFRTSSEKKCGASSATPAWRRRFLLFGRCTPPSLSDPSAGVSRKMMVLKCTSPYNKKTNRDTTQT